MLKAQKVKNVYAILKEIAGENLDTRDLLESAASLVEATEESLYEPNFSLNVGPPPISELPLHVVFEHMSWKVFNRGFNSDEESFYHQNPQAVLDYYLKG